MATLLARLCSYIFEPFTVSFLTLVLVVNSLGVGLGVKASWLALAVGLIGLPPILVFVYEKKIGKIKDWFMTNRLERRDVHLAWSLGSISFVLVCWWLQATRLLLALGLTFLVLSIIITLVSLYWKISVHMMGVTLFVLVGLLVYSTNFLWFLGLIPLVAWARMRLGAHTFLQVSLGTVLTLAATYLVFSSFGLATF